MLLRLNTFFLVLLLMGCGFTPMYGSKAENEQKSAVQKLSTVDIAVIPNANGVFLRNILIDQFYQNGYPQNPSYVLNINKIEEQKTDLDITIDSEATRKQIKLTTTMFLKDKNTDVVVLTRSLSAITSYNVLDSQFTTRISEQDVREAALADLARQIETQTILFLNR